MSKTTYEAKAPIIDDFCDPEPQEERFPGFPCFLFTQKEFSKSGSRDKMLCRCAHCGKEFWKEKHFLQRNVHDNRPLVYCSYECGMKHRTILASEKHPHPDEYACETCGKTVKWKNRYGAGRFCCEKCAKSFSGKIANSDEAKRKTSQSLKQTYKEHPEIWIISALKQHHPETSENGVNKVVQGIEHFKSLKDKIVEMQENWSLFDIERILGFKHIDFTRGCKICGLKENSKFLPLKKGKAIEACQHALGKPLTFGSITLDDLEYVRSECTRLMYEHNWTPVQICQDFLGHSFPYRQFICNILGVKFKSPSEAVRSAYKRKGAYKNIESKKKYKMECEFHMDFELHALLSNFTDVNVKKWYNKKCGKRREHSTRDHMISKEYGY